MDLFKRDLPYTLAVLVALAGSAGSVYLSTGLGLKACPLCFYQRTAVFLVAAGLLLGLVGGALLSRPTAAWLTVPAAFLGLGVAVWHVMLEGNGTLECPTGLLGLGTAPQQSLALFALLTPCVLWAALREGGAGLGRIGLAAGLGLLGAWLGIKSAPPLPPLPKAPYTDALVICRPPYKP